MHIAHHVAVASGQDGGLVIEDLPIAPEAWATTGLTADVIEPVKEEADSALAETQALHQVFGSHAKKLAVSATKSMHGHALGAASALEMIATVLSIHHNLIPPTANFTEPGEGCDLDYVPNTAREKKIRVAISNSFAFGGLNAVMVVKQPS